ncbi:hypothetical protein [Helicobacter sp. 11S02596-1]|uniref:hypothetical protein n=1 Tax=Helicobacter sp. 11S02596-1 TaxID=1476194 RepID=UPI001179F5F3|nr:hypothetical protein [Helicobacter sp. 11S02596-1]
MINLYQYKDEPSKIRYNAQVLLYLFWLREWLGRNLTYWKLLFVNCAGILTQVAGISKILGNILKCYAKRDLEFWYKKCYLL